MASSFAGRCLNTPSCWEVRGAFTLILLPPAPLCRFRGRQGVSVRGLTVVLADARIKQAYCKEFLQIFVGSDETPIVLDYHEILVITSESGPVWQ